MVGQFVRSKAGHDKDTVYVVIGEEGDFVMLCDGRLKLISTPKKKKKKHVQLINITLDPQMMESLQSGEIRDEQIKFAIRKYVGI